MSVALDLGSTEFRSYRRDGELIRGRRTPAVYCTAPRSPRIESILTEANIPFVTDEDSFVLLGQIAIESAGLMEHPVRPLFLNGFLPEHDAVARQILGLMIDALLPATERQSEKCGLCLPASASKQRGISDSVISQLLRLKGYQPLPLNPAVAVALGELNDCEMTGLTVVLGAESVAWALMHRGRLVFESVFARGFRTVSESFVKQFSHSDNEAAKNHLDDHRTSELLAAIDLSSECPFSAEQQWLLQALFDLLTLSWQSQLPRLWRQLDDKVLKEELAIVYSGGATQFDAFSELLRAVLERSRIPFKLGVCRTAGHSSFAVARGLLIHAELETNYEWLSRRSA